MAIRFAGFFAAGVLVAASAMAQQPQKPGDNLQRDCDPIVFGVLRIGKPLTLSDCPLWKSENGNIFYDKYKDLACVKRFMTLNGSDWVQNYTPGRVDTAYPNGEFIVDFQRAAAEDCGS